ncbi:MAG: exodeoxyribonuclease IX, partial [Gammaproteobacteria bacterium]|nr:exodeoxyribonuclease IX [Gammaproteobacteria bacterium]
RGQADGDALPELCQALAFGPMTRRRLHEATRLPLSSQGTGVPA